VPAKIEWDEKFGLVKINPSTTNSKRCGNNPERDTPYNALHDRSYPSIGCTHWHAPLCVREKTLGQDAGLALQRQSAAAHYFNLWQGLQKRAPNWRQNRLGIDFASPQPDLAGGIARQAVAKG